MTGNTENRSPSRDGDAAPDFESALAELDRIVQQLEDGSLGLEQSLAHFEQGIGLLRRCYETLEQAEQRVELLTGYDADGNPVTTGFPAATELEVSVEVERTEIEVTRERRAAPRKPSVEKRTPEPDSDGDREPGPTLF